MNEYGRFVVEGGPLPAVLPWKGAFFPGIYIYIHLLGPVMRQKMINLCPTTYDLAKRMPNFSGWVRRKILEMHDYEAVGWRKEIVYSKRPSILSAKPKNHWVGEEE